MGVYLEHAQYNHPTWKIQLISTSLEIQARAPNMVLYDTELTYSTLVTHYIACSEHYNDNNSQLCH
jgi:hypothetical protein